MQERFYEHTIITKDDEFYKDDYDLNTSCEIIKQMIKEEDIKLKDIKQMYIKEWLSNDNYHNDIREGDVFIITKKELKEE